MGPEPDPPQSASELRFRLLGSWKLESFIALPLSASSLSRPSYPMTKNVQGMILYTSDGYMSAQLYIPGQPPFKPEEASEAQWAEAGKRYVAYCGPYYIAEDGGKVILKDGFRLSNRPDILNDIQIRAWRFEEDGTLLVLGNDEPVEVKVSWSSGRMFA